MGGPNRHARHSVQIRSPLPSRLHQGPQNTRTTTKIIERSSAGSPGASRPPALIRALTIRPGSPRAPGKRDTE